VGPPSSKEAARDSAERRWNIELLNLFGRDPHLFGMISDAIDPNLQSTTDAELKCPGAGLNDLLRELAKRGILLP
jgi:hypothetical protein